MNKLLILPVALACTGAIASSNIPITGSVESKCVIQTDTDGVYGNPTADKLSTAVADGGVLPVVRYDIVTANAYKAVISHPDSFSSSPTLTDTVSWPLDFVITFDFDRMLDTDLCRLVIMSVEVLHFRIRKKFSVRLLDNTTALWRIILHAIVNRFQLA